jgi:hypothetical protein
MVAVWVALTMARASLACNSADSSAGNMRRGTYGWFRQRATDVLTRQVKNQSRDPVSVQFRDVMLFHQNLDSGNGIPLPGGGYSLCGEFNAKNAFGAYVGYTRFVSTTMLWSDTGEIAEGTSYVKFDDSDSQYAHSNFIKLYAHECKDEAYKPEDLESK